MASMTFSRILRAVAAGEYDGALANRLASNYRTNNPPSVTKSAMGETTGASGGYLVPTEFSTQILGSLSENSFILPRAEVVPMESAQTLLPRVNTATAQSAGTSGLFGGLLFTWGNSQTPPATQPTFQQVQLNAFDLLGLCTVSNQFLSDAGEDGDRYLLDLFGKAAAWYVEYAFLRGLGAGVSMPLGVLNAPGTLSVTRQVANQVQLLDVASMGSKLLPYSWQNAVWACSVTMVQQIVQLPGFLVNQSHGREITQEASDLVKERGKLSGSGGGARKSKTRKVLGDSCIGYLLARPVFVTDKLPPLGTAGDLVLFDPSLYLVGLRQEVLIDASTLGPAFRSYQTDFRVWVRLDGKPALSAPVTLADGSTQVSSCVVLS